MRSRAKAHRGEPRPNGGLKTAKGIPAPIAFRSPDTDTMVRMPNSRYTPSMGRKICEEIMQLRSLTAICSSPRMPSKRTVIRWLADPKLPEFREMYYYARRVQAELYVDEIFEIADDTTNDWKPTYNKDGEQNGWTPDNEAIQRSRVRIDARKWYAAKMVPRIYGEKLDVQHEVTGDLAELLKSASNKNTGLPKKVINE